MYMSRTDGRYEFLLYARMAFAIFLEILSSDEYSNMQVFCNSKLDSGM